MMLFIKCFPRELICNRSIGQDLRLVTRALQTDINDYVINTQYLDIFSRKIFLGYIFYFYQFLRLPIPAHYVVFFLIHKFYNVFSIILRIIIIALYISKSCTTTQLGCSFNFISKTTRLSLRCIFVKSLILPFILFRYSKYSLCHSESYQRKNV